MNMNDESYKYAYTIIQVNILLYKLLLTSILIKRVFKIKKKYIWLVKNSIILLSVKI